MPAPSQIFDVLIIGVGPAGLSAATALARQLYTSVVFSTNVFRNARTGHMHNVLGWDHQDPAVFRAKGREDLDKRYPGIVTWADGNKLTELRTPDIMSFGKESVADASDGKKSFEAIDMDGKVWKGRKVILATGVRDIAPPIEGYDECWGYGIFHCLFCHGYEERGGASAGVLAIDGMSDPNMALHVARQAGRLAKSVVLYTNGVDDVSQAIKKETAKTIREITVDDRKIKKFIKTAEGSSVTIEFEDGSNKTESFLAHHPKTEINGPFATQLGLKLTERGDIDVSAPFNETSMPGVFAAGDCATPMKAVQQAVTMGSFAAVGATFQLQMDPF